MVGGRVQTWTMAEMIENSVLFLITMGAFSLLMWRRVRGNSLWRATVTPLASIIGSGFLIVAPLLSDLSGKWAPFAMAGIVALAWGLGSVVRFNIRHAEPVLAAGNETRALRWAEDASRMALALAYIVSVTFYLRLMASFVMDAADVHSIFLGNMLATLVLAFIGVAGFLRGLGGLEALEETAVSVKLAIIVALLAGLSWHDATGGYVLDGVVPGDMPFAERLRMLAGMLLVVQGFETSRYLGHAYDADVRGKSMKLAQLLSAAIYILFVALLLPLLSSLSGEKPDETAIIGLSQQVASLLPSLLVVAAVMSQFSAAVADTAGAGGLGEEQSGGRLPAQKGYLLVAGAGIVIVWSADVFEIVAVASRAFAAYYGLQALVALLTIGDAKVEAGRGLRLIFTLLGFLMLLIALFALPVG